MVSRGRDWIRSHTSLRLRNRVAGWRVTARWPTGPLRSLADFLVIGTMRGGTSSLYRYLGKHPQIVPSLRKEIEFFTWYYGKGLTWYRAHFPLALRRQLVASSERPLLTFEATPYYLFHPWAASRAGTTLPEAKLIVLLRDPVDRAFSHYRHMRRLGLEDLTFEEAIRAEENRLAAAEERLTEDPGYVSKVHHRYSYLARGCYAEQLERWFARFDREAFLILRSEDLFVNPKATYTRILEFLGLPPRNLPAFSNYSYMSMPRVPMEEFEPGLRAELEEFFEPHNRKLTDLLETGIRWRRSRS